jgi:hypothetical protein
MYINETAGDRFRACLVEMGEEVTEAGAKGRFLALLSLAWLVAQKPPKDGERSGSFALKRSRMLCSYAPEVR